MERMAAAMKLPISDTTDTSIKEVKGVGRRSKPSRKQMKISNARPMPPTKYYAAERRKPDESMAVNRSGEAPSRRCS
jgi:hypothetical protein